MKIAKFDNREYIISDDYTNKEIISMIWGIHNNAELLCDNIFISYENAYNITFHITTNFMGMRFPSMLNPGIYNINIKELRNLKKSVYQL